MAYTARFLQPIRASFTAITSSPQSTTPFCGKLEPLKAWMRGLEPVLHNRCSSFRCDFNIQRPFMRNISLPGSKFCMGSIFGVSAVYGLLNLAPHVAYAMDGHDILADDHHVNSWAASDLREDPHAFWVFARKFWLPVIFFVTVLMNWDHPVTLAIKVILFLLSTKPSPFSVYLFIEQLRHQSMLQEPHLYKLKSLFANKVEVNDYKLLCLATVELRDQKFTLVGILGGWWPLPSSPWQEAFPVFKKQSFSVFRNRGLNNY
ncbi:hypothetical protein L1049_002066 [Liquidambar formosana]|uniref:Uncharacterized protein n=1 Tax=Liquidambar formosana TaxID=63359 RepID=A0AAP0NFA7_LIQFO